ncbi:MAG: AmmeMemoRadiSam system protein B [Desulfovibrionales bacterium]|nr:AmmeMemoRadiSam system protein B [Desulfovibrionales bacterium]
MLRQPVVAGQFYTADPTALRQEVETYLQRGTRSTAKTLLAMAPHAGYMYSGNVAGRTLGSARLADTIYLLGPNHTGRGALVSVWDNDGWQTPLGVVPIAEEARAGLLAHTDIFSPDSLAHIGEHSLEVLLPFIQLAQPTAKIVPVAVATRSQHTLTAVGTLIGEAIANTPDSCIVVSSDMSHFISADAAKRLDSMALAHVTGIDADGLFNTVAQHDISMCGVLPMTCGLAACELLGGTNARIIEYTTSGDVTGDTSQVVGYAGAIIDKP